ncbi:MAG: hypothetical protein ACYDEY_13615 [Acidimicrobiales bacterium]
MAEIALTNAGITCARLGQTHGYKRLFLAGISAFGLCSLAAASDPYEATVVVDGQQHVEPLEQHRVNVEEITRDEPLRLRGEELRPGRP